MGKNENFKVVNPQAYLTDISKELHLRQGGESPIKGGKVDVQFALMAGVERLFGRAGE